MAANSSLNDPVFWLHHANIDRIWNDWMRRHGQQYLPVSGGPIGHNLDDHMWPFAHVGIPTSHSIRAPLAAIGQLLQYPGIPIRIAEIDK